MKSIKFWFFFAALGLGLLSRVCAADKSPEEQFKSIERQFDALPPFYFDVRQVSQSAFNPRAYLDLAVALQKLGEFQAIPKLRELAKRPAGGPHASNNLIVLCRMLFVAKPTGTFRAPMWGGPQGLPLKSDAWALEPIAIVNGIPFLITINYFLLGQPEPAEDYLEYCIAECYWNPQKYVPLRDSSTGNHATVDKQLNASCAKFLLLNLPKEGWLDSDRVKFMQAQLQGTTNFSTRKSTLRYLLDDGFDMTSVPKEREDDFCEIVEAFIQTKDYRRDEFVRKIQFTAPDTATLQFSSGMDDGGIVHLKKKDGKWLLDGGAAKGAK